MSRRTERIAKVMQQAIGLILRKELADPRIDTARTSITRIEVQEDLLQAKVYVSVIGTDAQQRLAIAALNHAAGRVQSELRDRVSLRTIPRLEFLTDKRFKGAMQTWEIIRQATDELEENQRRREAAAAAEAPDAGEDSADDEAGEAR